jgi:uncharacterized protein DUF3570
MTSSRRRALRLLVLTAAFAAAALALAATRNWAQNNEANIQFHAFQDTRGVTVLTPSGDLTQDFSDRTTLRFNYGVDAISAASDSCVRCHRDGVHSHRQVAGLSATQKYGDLKVTFGGAYSQENFYRATTGLTSISRDFAKGNTTVAGGFSFSLNQPVLHPTPDRENQYSSDAFVSATQTLSKTTVAQVGYEFGHLSGYLDNPYLRADVNGIMVLGHVPDARTRHTFSARVRQALPQDTFLDVDFRHYFDDWQVTSNALNVAVAHHVNQQWLVNVGYRRYTQTGASFYQPAYVGVPTYYTADFRLEPFNSNDYIGKVVFTPAMTLLWFPRDTGLMIQYERYRADNGFEAGVLSTGLRVPLKAR